MKIKFILIFCLLPVLLSAQKIHMTIDVSYSHLSQDVQAELQDFQNRLDEYINGYQWTNDPNEVFIPMKISIILESRSQTSGNPLYKAQFLIATPSGENYYEKNWLFSYMQTEILTHDRFEYHTLASFIDYFIYLAIAGEADTYGFQGGNEFFDKARNILSQAVSSDPSSWTEKQNDFNEILDSDHLPLREAKYYFYQTLFLIEVAEGKNIEKIRENNNLITDKLIQVFKKRPNSKHLKRFMDSHFQDFCTLFIFDESDQNIQEIIKIDQLHKADYNDCIEKMNHSDR